MSDELVTLERRDGGVAVVRIDRPRMNALSAEVLRRLEAVAGELTAEPPGAVVVWGGDRIFAAGADVAELASAEDAAALGRLFRSALDALAAVPAATVAAINGYALGGGCELALACDLRVAADTARLGQPEVLLGIIPGGGATQRLTRLVGPSRAKDLILSGRQVTAAEALAIGLVDRVVASEQVLPAALELAGTFAGGATAALALAKRAIDEGLDGSLAEGLDLEQELFARSLSTEDAATGLRSFLEHGPGKARFAGR
jgi:enoyl-CoA hydratase